MRGTEPPRTGDIIKSRDAQRAFPRPGAAPMNYEHFLTRFGIPDPDLAARQNLHYARLLQGCSQVTDLGCGKGLFLEALRTLGIPCRGVEQNADLCETVRGKGFDCTHGDLFAFLNDAPSDSCGGLYASHVIEHMTPAQLEDFLAQCRRVLAPGGRIALVFPDCESLPMQLYAFWKDPTHVRFYHKEFVAFALEDMGLATRIETPFHMGAPASPRPAPAHKRAMKCIQRFLQKQLGLSGMLYELDRMISGSGEACVCAERR